MTFLTRLFRAALIAVALAFTVLLPAHAQLASKDTAEVEKISRHFSSVPSMMGEFIQFGPSGEQTGGKFFIQRPGKIRFDYADPSPILVKADAKTVGVNNKKLKNLYKKQLL